MSILCGSWGTVSHQTFLGAHGRRCCTVCTRDGVPWEGPECPVCRPRGRLLLHCCSCLDSNTMAPMMEFGISNSDSGILLPSTEQEPNSVEKWPTVLIDFTAGIDRPGNRPESSAKESIDPGEKYSRVWLARALMTGDGSISGTYG